MALFGCATSGRTATAGSETVNGTGVVKSVTQASRGTGLLGAVMGSPFGLVGAGLGGAAGSQAGSKATVEVQMDQGATYVLPNDAAITFTEGERVRVTNGVASKL